MKAVVCTAYGLPEVLQFRDVETPIPKKGEVRVRIYATAVTSSDCFVRSGKVSIAFWLPMRVVIGFAKPRQPILGMAFAGEVDSVDADARPFKKGDQVFGFDRYGFGTYAEYKCVSEKALLSLKPKNMNYHEAAAIQYGGLLALAFLRGNIHPDQNVLVYGASGAVGSSAVQLAKFFGARVTGVCSSTNLGMVRSLGADAIIDYTKESLAGSNKAFDLVFDAVGKRKRSQLKSQCKQALALNGRYITVDSGSPKLTPENLSLLKSLAEEGKLKPVIDRVYSLNDMAEAHRYVETGHKKGNVIIDCA